MALELEVVFSEHNPADWNNVAANDWTFSTVAAQSFTDYTPTNSAAGVRVDPDIYQWNLRRGRTDELGMVRAGTFSATLHDIARGTVDAGHWATSNPTGDYSNFRRGNSTDGSTNFSNSHLGGEVLVYGWTDEGTPSKVQLFCGKINSWEDTFFENGRRGVKFTAADGVADLSKVALGDGVMRNGDLVTVGTTTVSFDETGDPLGEDLWQMTNEDHELLLGDIVEFTAAGTGATGYAIDTPYWVVDTPDSENFRLAASRNGTVIAGTTDGSGWTVKKVTTPPTFPAQSSGTRVAAIADCINIETREQVWPGSGRVTGARNIDLGQQDIQPNDEQSNVWAMFKRIAESEYSPGLFIDRTGDLRFLGRFTTATASGVKFGTTTDTKIITHAAPDNYDRIYNQVTFYRTDSDGVLGGVPEKGEVDASQANYGIREMTRSNLLIETNGAGDMAAESLAQYTADFYAHDDAEALGELYFSPVTVIVQALSGTEQAGVFALDIGDEVTIENGATDITQVVNSISMSSTPGKAWTIKYTMTKAWSFGTSYAKIDDAKIDDGAGANIATIAPG